MSLTDYFAHANLANLYPNTSLHNTYIEKQTGYSMKWIITEDKTFNIEYEGAPAIGTGRYDNDLKTKIIADRAAAWSSRNETEMYLVCHQVLTVASNTDFTHEFRVLDDNENICFCGFCEEPDLESESAFGPAYWSSASVGSVTLQFRKVGDMIWVNLQLQ